MTVPASVTDLSRNSLFRCLPPTLMQQLQAAASARAVARGENLFTQGEPAHSLYLVCDGALRLLQYGDNGQAVTVRLFAPGDLCGLRAIIAGTPFPGTLRALKNSVALGFPGGFFLTLMQTCPELNQAVLGLLVEHVHNAHDLIRELSVESAEQRLARCVLRLAERFGCVYDDGILIDLPLSRQDLAEMTATRLETVSRIARRWELDGIVYCQRQQFHVLDQARLAQQAAR